MVDLYVKIVDGDSERFEPIKSQPSNQAVKVMTDHEFIRKALPTASLDQTFEILKLVWSVTKIQESMADSRFRKSEPA